MRPWPETRTSREEHALGEVAEPAASESPTIATRSRRAGVGARIESCSAVAPGSSPRRRGTLLRIPRRGGMSSGGGTKRRPVPRASSPPRARPSRPARRRRRSRHTAAIGLRRASDTVRRIERRRVRRALQRRCVDARPRDERHEDDDEDHAGRHQPPAVQGLRGPHRPAALRSLAHHVALEVSVRTGSR